MPTPKPNFDRKACSGCGEMIRWAVTSEGHPTPLNDKPITVYRWTGEGDNVEAIRVFVSHFGHCRKADQYRGKR